MPTLLELELEQRFANNSYRFSYDGMEDIVYEAITVAQWLTESGNRQYTDALINGLVEKVRNYAITGYANGHR